MMVRNKKIKMGPCFSNTSEGNEFTELLLHLFSATFIFLQIWWNVLELLRAVQTISWEYLLTALKPLHSKSSCISPNSKSIL